MAEETEVVSTGANGWLDGWTVVVLGTLPPLSPPPLSSVVAVVEVAVVATGCGGCGGGGGEDVVEEVVVVEAASAAGAVGLAVEAEGGSSEEGVFAPLILFNAWAGVCGRNEGCAGASSYSCEVVDANDWATSGCWVEIRARFIERRSNSTSRPPAVGLVGDSR